MCDVAPLGVVVLLRFPRRQGEWVIAGRHDFASFSTLSVRRQLQCRACFVAQSPHRT